MYNVGPYYAQDSYCYRTQDQLTQEFLEHIKDNFEITVQFPVVMEVCHICRGFGVITNRSIDGNGLDPNDPDLDEEFWDEYIRGNAYKVTCDECNGNNVVPAIDWQNVPLWLHKEWDEYCREYHDSLNYHLSEMRAGA